MKILKFGGTSVGDSKRIFETGEIIKELLNRGERIAVVNSAFKGVTDSLIKMGVLASQQDQAYLAEFQSLRLHHLKIIEELFKTGQVKEVKETVSAYLINLEEILRGVYILKDISPRTQDRILSFGERLSNNIITLMLISSGIDAEYLDASKLIVTDNQFGSAVVDKSVTYSNIKRYFAGHPKTQIITGFIAATPSGEITTLGRGGSDYTAALFGAALDANEIQIWTDVDGIMTADPRQVQNSIPLKAVTYSEAMELSHFGAKVIYPPTLQPAFDKKIKIRICNTFNRNFSGTVILDRQNKVKFNAKGISSIDDVSILRIFGSGMAGSNNFDTRIFERLYKASVPVLMITQGSSGLSLCLIVKSSLAEMAKNEIEDELRLEIMDNQISKVEVENECALLAVVGEDMRATPGIAGRVFQALGKNGVNIKVIAQGASELNISFAIKSSQLQKALNVVHDEMFLSNAKIINIFLAGPGLVGSALLKYIDNKAEHLQKEFNSKFKIVAIANSKKMLFDNSGIEYDDWETALNSNGIQSSPEKFVDEMLKKDFANSVFVDCTANSSFTDFYPKILGASISIATPNKIANTRGMEFYKLLRTSAKRGNSKFKYTANVGAALPIVNLIKSLTEAGESLFKLEGILSGTMSYLFNTYNAEKPFAEVVRFARDNGFTEPDPRDDLNGLDMARKLLILIREAGIQMELSDIEVESLVPETARTNCSVDEFFEILLENESYFSDKFKKAATAEKKIKYIAKYENGKAKLGLQEISAEHPFANMTGAENILSIYTDNYDPNPLTIRGRGAGADYTAFGIFTDLINISQNLG